VSATQAMVDAAASPACDEHKLRFQILNGTLWVDHSMHPRAEAGWYPAPMGQGVTHGLQAPESNPTLNPQAERC